MQKISRAEVNKRLIKRAQGQFNYLGQGQYRDFSNEQRGQAAMQHMMHLAMHSPSSPEGAAYIKEHGIDPVAAQHFNLMGTRLLNGAVGNYGDIAGAVESGNFEKIPGINEFMQQADNGTLFTDSAARLELAKDTQAARPYLDEQGNFSLSRSPDTTGQLTHSFSNLLPNTLSIPGTSLSIPLAQGKENFAAYMHDIGNNPDISAEVRRDMLKGMASGYDRNNPFVQKLMANAATGYLRNRINEYLPTSSPWSHGLNSISQLLLGLASKMPGYDYLANKFIDWQYGDKLNAIPARIAGLQSTAPPPSSFTPPPPSDPVTTKTVSAPSEYQFRLGSDPAATPANATFQYTPPAQASGVASNSNSVVNTPSNSAAAWNNHLNTYRPG